MAAFQSLFATRLYQARLSAARNRVLEKTCLGLAAEDRAGQRWAREHGYGGYTSYASLNDLTRRASVLAELERDIARHVAVFARDAQFDLGGRKLALDSLWINVMDKGAVHAAHIHPHSVVSGTYYVTVPDRAGAIQFEDPRLPMLMAAPPGKPTRGRKNAALSQSHPNRTCFFYGKAGCGTASDPMARGARAFRSVSITPRSNGSVRCSLRRPRASANPAPCYCDRITMGGRS